LDIKDGVMLATLNRPERMNSLSPELMKGLYDALKRASRDDDVKVIVLTGNGRAFCAGAEVSAGNVPAGRSINPPADPRPRHERMSSDGPGSIGIAEAFASSDVPIIGAINGTTAGGGFGIALSCDVRILAESVRIGSIFIKRGISADFGAAYWLARIVGVGRAFELFYEGGLIDAQRALEIGLANKVVPDAELIPEAMAMARRIAEGPPMGYTTIRRMVIDSVDAIDRGTFLEREMATQAVVLRSADAAEGFQSFLEKRPPKFTGN
jgi:2-(1,2-epoxy-1,2-dihydrophenyl)acetyl-CoA isomerase